MCQDDKVFRLSQEVAASTAAEIQAYYRGLDRIPKEYHRLIDAQFGALISATIEETYKLAKKKKGK